MLAMRTAPSTVRDRSNATSPSPRQVEHLAVRRQERHPCTSGIVDDEMETRQSACVMHLRVQVDGVVASYAVDGEVTWAMGQMRSNSEDKIKN